MQGVSKANEYRTEIKNKKREKNYLYRRNVGFTLVAMVGVLRFCKH